MYDLLFLGLTGLLLLGSMGLVRLIARLSTQRSAGGR